MDVMYEDYFGLWEKPFSLTPDPAFFYRSPTHGNALDLFQHAFDRRDGVIAVTGTSGTGKTTLCRRILNVAERNTFTALVLNPYISREDLLQLVLQDFGVISREEARPSRSSALGALDLLRTLHHFLHSLVPLGARALLLVDEAQKLPRPVLEQVQRLAALTERGVPLLQIGLVGQLNLRETLRAPELRDLASRITIRYRLNPLTADQTAAYVAHRMSVAGDRSASTFTGSALHRVHTSTGGNPRLINLLCDRALAGGYAVRRHRIDDDLVFRAAYALGLEPTGGTFLSWFRSKAAAL
jgi:general secretion pathway protein A